jgi:hypothetical protein
VERQSGRTADDLFRPLVGGMRRAASWVFGPPPARLSAKGARGTDLFQRVVVGLIAVVSVCGATVAWRASVFASSAEAQDQHSIQQLVQKQEILAVNEGAVAEDERLFGIYGELAASQARLSRQSVAVRATDPALSATLASQAYEDGALIRAMPAFFSVQNPSTPDSRGNATYDRRRALAGLNENASSSLGDLHPKLLRHQADVLHTKTVHLIGAGALLVVALFFLTLAEILRPVVRVVFAGFAVVSATLGLLWFVVAGP